jgi:uncharacterized protein RhaS with RHS repeats
VPTLHLFDLDGHEVRTVANYDDATYDPVHPDIDITTDNRFDLNGGVVGVTDVLGRVTSTERDTLGRATKVIRPDLSWIRTDYTPRMSPDCVLSSKAAFETSGTRPSLAAKPTSPEWE